MRQKLISQKVMSKQRINAPSNKGFTFVEIMIALAIGIALTFMTLTIFANNKRAYDTNNRMIEMNENIRFALTSIVADLENAGFYGGADTITKGAAFANVDCNYTADPIDATEDIATSIETYNAVWGKSAAKPATCLTTITAGTDYISIRGVRGKIYADDKLKGTSIYIRTGGKEGAFRDSENLPSVANASNMNWEYYSNIYFVCENRLLRKTLYYNTGNSQTQWKLEVLSGPDLASTDPLVATCSGTDSHEDSGIERMNLLFGMDSNQDGVADYYATGDNIDKADMAKIIEVKLYLLARSAKDESFSDTGSYNMGATSYTPTVSNQKYHRKLYTRTFFLRNNWNRIKNDPSNL